VGPHPESVRSFWQPHCGSLRHSRLCSAIDNKIMIFLFFIVRLHVVHLSWWSLPEKLKCSNTACSGHPKARPCHPNDDQTPQPGWRHAPPPPPHIWF
jgi:hypothetical protein